MAKQEFTLDSLRKLDFGLVPQHFQKELERAVADCRDRPIVNTKREVTVKFYLTPLPHQQGGDLDEVHVECEIFSAIPKYRTRPYQMTPLRGNKLAFNPDNPEDADQQTLMDHLEREEDERNG